MSRKLLVHPIFRLVHYAGQSIIVREVNLGKTLAKTPEDSFMRLIHLTDPHLSSLTDQSFMKLRGKRRSGYLSWYKKRRHVHRPEVLEQLTQAVLAESPDQVLLTGDLVHIGLEQEMIEAAQWLARLGTPGKVMLVPGNHDNYARDSGAAMYRHWGEYLPDRGPRETDYTAGYPVVREFQNLKLLGVNTSCVTRIFSAAGELGEQQCARLSQTLAKEPGDRGFQCLLIHHPPLPGMTSRRKGLRDAGQLESILRQSRPNLVLYGHLHCNREHLLENSRIYCTASASSSKNASYRVFDLEQNEQGWRCRMRLMTLGPGAGAGAYFNPSAESAWVDS
jgi:3',5'-cyclic AMP phosphodiesterase CpdA